MSETTARTWFDQMAAAVAQLEQLGSVVSAEDLVASAYHGEGEDLSDVQRWIRNARDFLVEIDVALRERQG